MATPNALFAIINVSNPEALMAKLMEIMPWAWMELEEGQWLLVAPSATTSKEVSDRLGFSSQESTDSGLILRVDSYYGRNLQSTWDWIATKQGAELGTVATAQR